MRYASDARCSGYSGLSECSQASPISELWEMATRMWPIRKMMRARNNNRNQHQNNSNRQQRIRMMASIAKAPRRGYAALGGEIAVPVMGEFGVGKALEGRVHGKLQGRAAMNCQ